MRLARAAATGSALIALGVALAGTAVAAPAQDAQPTQSRGESRPGTMVDVRVGTPLKTPSYVRASSTVSPGARAAAGASFNVTYTGFTPAAQAAFQRAVDIWASQLNTTVPITVQASFEPLGANVLGQAGPSSIWRNFSGAPKANTWYVDAIANKRSGTQQSATPDIVARFSSNFTNWYYGTGAAPAGTYDFTSVVLHELGHGVGFLGGSTVSGGQGSLLINGDPLAYSRFTKAGSKKLLSYPDGSTQLAAALQSNNVFFNAGKVNKANGGTPAKLFAPSTWQPGSSYSHLDEATFPAGNANSLMTPAIGSGETVRDPGPITRAVLLTTGW